MRRASSLKANQTVFQREIQRETLRFPSFRKENFQNLAVKRDNPTLTERFMRDPHTAKQIVGGERRLRCPPGVRGQRLRFRRIDGLFATKDSAALTKQFHNAQKLAGTVVALHQNHIAALRRNPESSSGAVRECLPA